MGTEVMLVPPLHTWFLDLELCSVIAFPEKYPLSTPEKLFILLTGGSNSIKTSRTYPPIHYSILRDDKYVKHEAREAKRLAQHFTVFFWVVSRLGRQFCGQNSRLRLLILALPIPRLRVLQVSAPPWVSTWVK